MTVLPFLLHLAFWDFYLEKWKYISYGRSVWYTLLNCGKYQPIQIPYQKSRVYCIWTRIFIHVPYRVVPYHVLYHGTTPGYTVCLQLWELTLWRPIMFIQTPYVLLPNAATILLRLVKMVFVRLHHVYFLLQRERDRQTDRQREMDK